MDCNLQTITTWNGLSGKKWGLTNENKKRTIRIINPGIVVIPILVLLHLIQTGAIDTISKKTSVKTNKIRENPGYWYKYGKFSILVTGVILALFFIPVVNAQAPTAAFSGTPTTGTAPLAVTFTDQFDRQPHRLGLVFRRRNYSAPWTELTSNVPGGWNGSSTPAWRSRMATLFSWEVMPKTLFFGDDTNDVWRSTDGGATWTEMNVTSPGWRRGLITAPWHCRTVISS